MDSSGDLILANIPYFSIDKKGLSILKY